jgi:hypothetical protein
MVNNDRENKLRKRRSFDDFWIICIVLGLIILGALGGVHVNR